MDAVWLIEDELFEESSSLIDEIKKQNFKYHIINKEIINNMTGIYFQEKDDVYLYHGSFEGLEFLNSMDAKILNPINLDKYLCSYYYPKFGELLLNQDYILLPYGDLANKKLPIVKLFGLNIFIRPDTGDKAFTGTVISVNDLDCLDFNLDSAALVLISKAEEIIREWRLIVVDKQVVAGCIYHDKTLNIDYLGYPYEIKLLAEKVLSTNSYDFEEFLTMDFCESRSGQFKLLELNSFACAGWYDCDLTNIVGSIKNKFCKKGKNNEEI